MGWWNQITAKKEDDGDELKQAIEQYNLAIAETANQAKKTSQKSNGILQTAENALQIINRAERELQSLKKVFKNEDK